MKTNNTTIKCTYPDGGPWLDPSDEGDPLPNREHHLFHPLVCPHKLVELMQALTPYIGLVIQESTQ